MLHYRFKSNKIFTGAAGLPGKQGEHEKPKGANNLEFFKLYFEI